MDINKLNNKIIGAAIEIHKTLGPVLLESAYPVKYTIYKITACWNAGRDNQVTHRSQL